MSLPRPETPPQPPRPGDLERVRRRAMLRRARIPAGATALLLVAVAITASRPADGGGRLDFTDRPPVTGLSSEPEMLPSSTTASPAISATVAPPATPTPTLSALRSPSRPATPSPSHSPSPSPQPPPPTVRPTPSPTLSEDPYACERPTTGPDITGEVVDESGRPLAGMTVTGMRCVAKTMHSGRRIAVTGSDGRFRIPCYDHWNVVAPYEWYTADRSSDANYGYVWLTGFYDAVPCGSHHRVVLPPGATLELSVVDAEGKPVRGRDLEYGVGLFDARDEATNFATLRPDDNGKAVFRGLPPGQFMLYASPEPYKYFEVAKGGTARVTYQMRSR